MDKVTCSTCLMRRVPEGNVKHCSRPCTIRAADLRRRGLPEFDPGYTSHGHADRLPECLRSVRAMRKRALSRGQAKEATLLGDATKAMSLALDVRRVRVREARRLLRRAIR